MYNILIVDDETIIRENIARLVEDISSECTIFQANNGIKAIEIVCSTQIDIIFADIKMPICDGIEMLEKLSALEYPGQTIVISGFDDYDFVRKAMKLGAVDYIIKPIVISEFRTIFNECIAKIQSSYYVNNFYSADRVKKITELLFSQQRMISQLINETDEKGSLSHKNNLSQYPYVSVAVMDIFRAGHILETEKQAMFLRIESIFYKCFCDNAILIQGEFNRLWMAVIFLPSSDTLNDINIFHKLLMDEGIKFGIADALFPSEEVSLAYNAAMISLENFFYDIPVEDDSWDHIDSYEAIIDSIVNSICNCDFNGFSENTYSLFSMICHYRPEIEETRQLLANIPYNVMKKNSEYISIIGKYKFTENDVIHAIKEALSASQARKMIISIFNLYMSDLKNKHESQDEYAIQKAKKFIESDYKDGITLGEIAERLGYNSNYLSTLFKEKTGTTFSDYLRKVRISEAIKLMRVTNMKLYDIAFMVGYKDSANFYRAFKRETGVSPGQYRENMTIS